MTAFGIAVGHTTTFFGHVGMRVMCARGGPFKYCVLLRNIHHTHKNKIKYMCTIVFRKNVYRFVSTLWALDALDINNIYHKVADVFPVIAYFTTIKSMTDSEY